MQHLINRSRLRELVREAGFRQCSPAALEELCTIVERRLVRNLARCRRLAPGCTRLGPSEAQFVAHGGSTVR